MKIPTIEWEDLYSMGLPSNTTIEILDNKLYCDNCSKLIKNLLQYCIQYPPPSDRWSYIRHLRDALIAFTDWTQNIDSPLSMEKKLAWAEYRQSLRDLPSVCSDAGPIPWPVAP